MTAGARSTKPGVGAGELAMEQAAAAIRAGDPAAAERGLRGRLLENPRDIGALTLLADMLASQDRLAESALLVRRAIAAGPEISRLRLGLAHLLHRQGLLEDALAEVGQLGPDARGSYQALELEAALLGGLGRHDEQRAIYKRLVAAVPRNPALRLYFANALKTVGRAREAVDMLRRAIKLRPSFGEAYWALANLKSFRFHDRDIAAMRLALRGKPDSDDATHLHFALGRALEQKGETGQAFEQYRLGNACRAGQLTWPQMLLTPRVDSALATFDPDLFERKGGGGDPSPEPIFVLGLQRSGSTLVEQILATHPMIEGTSELFVIEQLWTRLGMTDRAGSSFAEIARLDRAQLAELGAEYLERTRAFRKTGRPFFIDKQPANWLNVGFIRLILPNARIIDARRHPMATGLSNFIQLYASGVSFAYDLKAIGTVYRDYLRLMGHFDRVQPGTIHHMLNERLIEDPEAEVRRLLNFLGLPYDPGCLEFHRNPRAVATPSAEQVRRPINREGVEAWRRFEPWLEPLKDALGESLELWDKI